MPRDTSIHKILVIGSGPIVIGQSCEVVHTNSNPATIMTDPEFAHRF